MVSKMPKQIEWVKLAKYCELTGETRDSVMKNAQAVCSIPTISTNQNLEKPREI